MRIDRSSKFNRKFKRLPAEIKARVGERLALFVADEFNPRLGNHKLHGKYVGCRSIDITGDYRIIYERQSDEICLLITLGTHPELYKS